MTEDSQLLAVIATQIFSGSRFKGGTHEAIGKALELLCEVKEM